MSASTTVTSNIALFISFASGIWLFWSKVIEVRASKTQKDQEAKVSLVEATLDSDAQWRKDLVEENKLLRGELRQANAALVANHTHELSNILSKMDKISTQIESIAQGTKPS